HVAERIAAAEVAAHESVIHEREWPLHLDIFAGEQASAEQRDAGDSGVIGIDLMEHDAPAIGLRAAVHIDRQAPVSKRMHRSVEGDRFDSVRRPYVFE